jgi:hypothetical protein
MTWIRTIPISEASPELQNCLQEQQRLYPSEYATPVESLSAHQQDGPAIVMAHSLLPKTLYHAFATYGSLMSPELPLSRKQHEMIAATVSALNRCFY